MAKRLVLTLAYFITGWLGLKLPFIGTHITLIWLPTGIAVAALYRWGFRVWPAVYLGAWLVNLATGAGWALAAAIAVGNTLGPLLSAAWLKRSDFHSAFDRQKDVGLLVTAAGAGMTLPALGGVACLYLAGVLPWDEPGFSILSWWLGDTIGVLLAAPLLLTLSWGNLRHLHRTRAEFALWLLTAAAIAWFALIHNYRDIGYSLPLAFLTIPLLTWAGLRFGNTGTTLAGLVFSGFAAWGTANGQGFYVLPDVRTSLFVLWIYMATTVLTGLLITALQAERLKMERELRASTDELNNAQQIANLGSWRLDHADHLLSWSDEIFRLLEIDAQRNPASEELFAQAIHPEDRVVVNQVHLESLANGTPYEISHRLLMNDGRVKWVHQRCKTDFDNNGKPLCSRGTLQDITELKLAEESLRKFSLAVEQSPSSIMITDLQANIEFANEAFFKITGYDHDEAIGRNPRILQSGKTPKQTFADMWAALRRGESWRGEFVNRRKDGSEYIETALISPLHHNGIVTHYLAIKEDVTDRKRAESALRESHQQMYSLLNSMAEGAFGLDSEGNCQFVNRSFLRILGYDDAQQFIGKPIHPIIHHSQADGRPCPLDECPILGSLLHRRESHVSHEVFWSKTGEAVPVEYWSQPLIIDGVVSGVVATFIDISQRKQAEQAAQRAAQYARGLIEASLDPLVTINAEGKITDVNTATEQATGLDRGALIGSDFADYFTDPEQARAGYRLVFSQGFVTDYPLALRHPSGKLIEVLYNASIYRDTDGNVLGVLAAARDVTERKQIEARLTYSESRLRAIIETEPECIKLVDAEGRLLSMNPAGLKMIEADSQEQVAGQPVLDLIAEEYRDAFADMHSRVLGGEAMQMEYEIIGLKGGRRWLETHAVPMREADGTVVHLAVTRDIDERKQAENELRIAATVFGSQEGMMVTDAQQRILRVNKAFTDITGYTADEVIGRNPNLLHSNRHPPEFYTAMWDCIQATGEWSGEIWNRRKNGEVYPDYLTITAVKDKHGNVTHYVGTHLDITLRKAAADEIERLAFYDPLTGLPNRRLLQNRLQPAFAASHRNGRKGALLFIDLDNFKSLNDTLGHDIGDLLLQQVAERLSASVREGDTVARLGGDEFVVMLQDLSEQTLDAAKQAETIGNKILAVLNHPYQLASHQYINTPSIGATLINGHEKTVDELLKHADMAMYQAKLSGRNVLRFFDPQMQQAVAARYSLEDELRHALDRQQFQLYYQVQVDGDGRALGAEALIRWRHPQRGLMAPDQFIALAEETGLILPLGQWVIETACAQLQAWQQAPLTCRLSLSVNISAKQFFHANFAARLREAIERHAVDPALLELELTEQLLFHNIDNTLSVIKALAPIGVRLSLDNFGTGYSSLQHLPALSLTRLQIDRSLVAGLNDNDARTTVRTILAMADSLGMGVIAEGVETEQQRRFLLDNGCIRLQGYLFGKPLAIAKFNAMLAADDRRFDDHASAATGNPGDRPHLFLP